jgi:enediyne biosynthesis protein E5
VSAPGKPKNPRSGLRNSAALATVFTIFGHALFGFEQSVAHVFVALATGYSCALLFELLDATANRRRPGFLGGGVLGVIDFLLSAHMTSITMSFLVVTNVHFTALAFMVALAIGSKYFFRVEIDGRLIHFMNPSNFGLIVGVILFPWTCFVPWAFTTRLHGVFDWLLPAAILLLGIRLNLVFTKRMPLISAFVIGFAAQAAIRAFALGNPLAAELAPLANVPVVLFTFYMITDPRTSPSALAGQLAFGVGVAATYGVCMALHYNYGLLLGVALAGAVRGSLLWAKSTRRAGPLELAGVSTGAE